MRKSVKFPKIIGKRGHIILVPGADNSQLQGVVLWDRDYITVEEYMGISAYIKGCKASDIDVNRKIDGYKNGKDIIKLV